LAIFGATGRTGRVVVEHALWLGHEVTALTRDPARIAPRSRLHVVGGDVRDPAAVAGTLHGADAIVSTLGRRRRGPDVCTEGIRAVLSHAADHGPRRLILLSNYGVTDSRHRTAYVTASWLLEQAILRDKEQTEALLRTSSHQRAPHRRLPHRNRPPAFLHSQGFPVPTSRSSCSPNSATTPTCAKP
jgi:putative NADH-flavin reductase